MSECPACHQQIEIPEASRGTLFTCPRCNAVYFVGWDGVPEKPAPDHYAAEPVTEAEPAPPEVAFENPPEISVENPVIEQEWAVPDGQNPDESAGSYASESDPYASPAQENETVYAEEPAAADETPYDFDRPLADNPAYNPQPPAVEVPSTADEPGFQDVADFGNSDTSSGPLSYTIVIEGIDTGKIYGELREALTDSRFRWNVPEMLKTIHEGRMEIKDLNPAKAFMLVNRVKYLALKITWRQDVLS